MNGQQTDTDENDLSKYFTEAGTSSHTLSCNCLLFLLYLPFSSNKQKDTDNVNQASLLTRVCIIIRQV